MTLTIPRTRHAGRPSGASPVPEEDRVGLAINLLGRPSVLRDGQEVAPPRGRKVWALLAYLLLAGAPPGRSRLAGLLFGDADDPLAALRWNLVELRRLLGPDTTVGGEPVRLELPPDATVDLRLLTSGTWVEAGQIPGLGRELLEGVEIAGSSTFETWLLAERRRFTGLSAAVLREAATARLAAGDGPTAIGLATRLVALDEYDEEAHALLVRAYSAAGDTGGARRQLATAVALFRRELGVEPSAALLGAADPGAAAPAAAPVRGAAAARALLEAGEAAIGAGAVEPGLESLRRAVAAARDAADPALECRALLTIGSAYVHATARARPRSTPHSRSRCASRQETWPPRRTVSSGTSSCSAADMTGPGPGSPRRSIWPMPPPSEPGGWRSRGQP
jgi:DNA-binding SARP family transcriptional activator